jgi:hypothetical protein
MKFQFTFYDYTNTYKPVSTTVVLRPQEKINTLKRRALKNILIEHSWTYDEMMNKYGYTKYKYRRIREDKEEGK